MAEPVKKDDALAVAMREAFQRHMANAADAARTAQHEPVRLTQRFPARPVPAEAVREEASRDPVSRDLASRDLSSRDLAPRELALAGDGRAEAPRGLPLARPLAEPPSPPPASRPAAAPALRELRRPVRPAVEVPDPAAAGAALAQRAREAVQEGRRLRPPPPVNDVGPLPERPPASPDTASAETRLAETPDVARLPAAPVPDVRSATMRSAETLQVAPRPDATAVPVAARAPAAQTTPLSRLPVMLAGGVVIVAALAGAGLWLRPSLTAFAPEAVSDLRRVVGVVRGMWSTPRRPAPLLPADGTPAADSVAQPTPTADQSPVAFKGDMLTARHVTTTPVRVDPVAIALQDAQDRLARGDLASARLILEGYRAAGDPRALIALAETFDPVEQKNPDAQDRGEAATLYEQAARNGSQQAAERLARLKLTRPD